MENIEKAKDAFARLKAGKIDEAEKLFKKLLEEDENSFYGNLGMADVELAKLSLWSLTISYVEKAAKSSYSPEEEEKSFIKQMLNDIVYSPKESDNWKYSLLSVAANEDNCIAVKFLLENGADPNYKAPVGWGALHSASCNSSKKRLKPNALIIGELLVDYGVTYNVKEFINYFKPEYAPIQEFVDMLKAGPNLDRKEKMSDLDPSKSRKKVERYPSIMRFIYDLKKDNFNRLQLVICVLCLICFGFFFGAGLYWLYLCFDLGGAGGGELFLAFSITAVFGALTYFLGIRPIIRFYTLKAKYMEFETIFKYEEAYENKVRRIKEFKRDFFSICIKRGVYKDLFLSDYSEYHDKISYIGREIMDNTFSDEELFQLYLRGQEEAIKEENRLYMDYTDVSKTIAYCKAQLIYWREVAGVSGERAAYALNDGERMYDLFKERERSWGLAGGIAEGIAGVGAGVAAAIDAQIDNIGIQQRNAELKSRIDKFQTQVKWNNVQRKRTAESEIKLYEERIAECPRKRIEKVNEQTYLKLLNPTIREIEYRDTGAVYMRVIIKDSEYKYNIFGSIPATIDGCIKAEIVDKKGTVIGSGYMALPAIYSRSSTNSSLVGIADIPAGTDPAGLKVRFVPHHLWAIEA